jgi:hypothetical protein
MKRKFYISYSASMEAHIGMLTYDSEGKLLNDMEYARSVRPENSRLLAYVAVYVNGSEIPTAAAIDEIIDDGFQQIGIPELQMLYEKQTKNGRFELLWRPGFPSTAASAKATIHEVVAKLRGSGMDTVVYCGKPEQLFRYGTRGHLTEALKLGRFRIAPAKSYGDLSDDPARQDDELRRTFKKSAESLVITTTDGAILKPKGEVKFVSKRAADYYVLCLSMEQSRTVAEQFTGCETCLVIKDPVQFTNRLHAEIQRILPDYTGFGAPVSYGSKSQFGICFTKSDTFSVQSEFRFAWTKANETGSGSALSAFFVEIGSIEDIAELVDLPK